MLVTRRRVVEEEVTEVIDHTNDAQGMKYEKNRLKSLSSWWLNYYQLDAGVAKRLAKAGFYCTLGGTLCFSCGLGKSLSFWKQGYHPEMVHREERPDCEFLNGQSDNVPNKDFKRPNEMTPGKMKYSKPKKMKLNQNSKQYANDDEIMLRTEQREQEMGRNTERTKHKEAETKTSSRRQVQPRQPESVASSAAEPHQTGNRSKFFKCQTRWYPRGIQRLVSTLIFRGGEEGYSRVVKTQSPKFWPTFHFRGGGIFDYSRLGFSWQNEPKILEAWLALASHYVCREKKETSFTVSIKTQEFKFQPQRRRIHTRELRKSLSKRTLWLSGVVLQMRNWRAVPVSCVSKDGPQQRECSAVSYILPNHEATYGI